MSTAENSEPSGLPVPAEVLRQYPGKVIVYSDEEGRVLGVGDTEQEAEAQARLTGVKGVWHISCGSLVEPDSMF